MHGRRSFRNGIALWVVLGCVGCQLPWTVGSECNAHESVQRITFLHVNDLHASIAPTLTDVSPWSRIKALHSKVLLENPHTIFTDGGDVFEKGSLADTLSAGWATIEMVRAMRFDVRVMGNHDFSWSLERALELSRDPVARTLCSNMRYTGEDAKAWGAVEFTRMQVGCVSVGFFGMTSRPYNQKNEEYDGPYYPPLQATYDFVGLARRLVAQHRSEVDVMVMLSHIGLPDDLRVAREVPGIDVVLSAHTHDTTTKPLRAGNAWVIQAGRSAQAVARLDVDVNLQDRTIVGHRFRLLTNLGDHLAFTPDSLAHQGQELWNAAISGPNRDPDLAGRLWTAMHLPSVDLDLENRSVRLQDQYAPDANQAIGCLSRHLADHDLALLAAQAAQIILQTDTAMVDPAVVLREWKQGLVLKQGLLDTFPVERQPPGTAGHTALVTTRVTGAQLAQLRQHAPAHAWTGIPNPDPASTYTLAISRQDVARFMSDHSVQWLDAEPHELWKVLDEFSRNDAWPFKFTPNHSRVPECW